MSQPHPVAPRPERDVLLSEPDELRRYLDRDVPPDDAAELLTAFAAFGLALAPACIGRIGRRHALRFHIEPPLEEEIRTATETGLDREFLRAWNADLDAGFWCCYQALYRRLGQPALAFSWLVQRLADGVTPEPGARASGMRGFSERVVREAWMAPAARTWHELHPTPLTWTHTGRAPDTVRAHWQPLLLAAALVRVEPRTETDWQRVLTVLRAEGLSPARAVDLLMPMTAFA